MSNVEVERRQALCNQIIDGRAVAEWDESWLGVNEWWKADTPLLRAARGLVRFTLNGEVMAIGRASDNRWGIAKKFRDLVRPSPSSRDHHAGRLIFENRYDLTADIIVTGEDRNMERVNIALRKAMIELYRPLWNVPKTR